MTGSCHELHLVQVPFSGLFGITKVLLTQLIDEILISITYELPDYLFCDVPANILLVVAFIVFFLL